MSLLLASVAAQKNASDLIHTSCSEVGITRSASSSGVLGGCGRTYAKLYSSPSLQSKCQKPSFMSYFAMKIFALLSASANAWIIRKSKWPS